MLKCQLWTSFFLLLTLLYKANPISCFLIFSLVYLSLFFLSFFCISFLSSSLDHMCVFSVFLSSLLFSSLLFLSLPSVSSLIERCVFLSAWLVVVQQVGEVIGARLMAHSGSLLNLSKQPASTIQILGAEKALFRALKTKSHTPKYGLLYHASLVGQAPPRLKGKDVRSSHLYTHLSSYIEKYVSCVIASMLW